MLSITTASPTARHAQQKYREAEKEGELAVKIALNEDIYRRDLRSFAPIHSGVNTVR